MPRLIWLLAAGLGGIALLAGAALVIAAAARSEDPDLATTAPALPTRPLTTPTATATSLPAEPSPTRGPSASTSPILEPSPTATAEPQPDESSVDVFEIDPSQSSSKFVVQKVVLGFSSNALATGKGVTGRFYVSPEGLDSSSVSTFQLDMRSLDSADVLLSRFLSSGALDVESFPFADFVAAASSRFPADYANGSQFSFDLSGTLTLNGVSRPATWQVLARHEGEYFTATADTDVNLSDFDVEVPNLALGSASDSVHVQVVMIALLQ